MQINDCRMTSKATVHWAVPVTAGEPYGTWWVSWLPGRELSRSHAITAMTLAEAVAAMQEEGRTAVVDHTHRLWPHIDQWADELGLTGPEAVVQVSDSRIPAEPDTSGGR